MKRYSIPVVIFWAIICSGFKSYLLGQEGLAGVPGSYLFMGVGARALSMGGAYSAIANDATAVYWNPAGLATLDPYQISFTHAILFVDTSLDFLAVSAPTERYGSFGAALLALTSGDFEQRTALNEVVGNFNTRDLAVLVSWSKELFSNFSLGLNYKFVNQKILTYSGSGHGVDLGLQALLFERLQAGLVFRNILNPKVTLARDEQTFPMQISAGLSNALVDEQLILSVEYDKVTGWGDGQFHLGGEFKFIDRVAFRLGLSDESITFGAGFSFDKFGVGYSNVASSELGSSHRFSLNYSFGGFGLNASAAPRVFSPSGEQNITRIRLKVKSRTEIDSWFFGIVDSNGRIVRQFKQTGQPPKEIIWDGRDGMGSLVADGTFNYLFSARTIDAKDLNAEGTLVSIDSKGPLGVFASEEKHD